jgi:UPF0755 protein
MMFKHTKKRLGLKVVAVMLGVVFLFGAGGVFALRQWYVNALKPASASSEVVQVTIESGASPKSIGTLLKQKGLIRNERAFETYVRGSGDADKLKAGTFEISASMSTQEIVSVLIEGQEVSTLFTVGPGQRIDQLKKKFVGAGFSAQSVEEAFVPEQYDDIGVMKHRAGGSLEGFIFPETFQIELDSTPKDIVRRSILELDALVTEELEAKFAAQGISTRDAIILASIIEKEVPGVNDRKQVAQVFYTRLAEGIPLGADATYLYDAAVNGGLPFPENTSDYNTRKVGGLPPGPISNFSSTALLAVAEPANTDYLFYVTGDDGTNHFSRTSKEHEEATRNFCTVTCAAGYIPPDLR